MCPVDNGPAGDRKTGTATVYVEVLDVNDNRPIFLQNSYETTILENIPRGTSVLQVRTQVHIINTTSHSNTSAYTDTMRRNIKLLPFEKAVYDVPCLSL